MQYTPIVWAKGDTATPLPFQLKRYDSTNTLVVKDTTGLTVTWRAVTEGGTVLYSGGTGLTMTDDAQGEGQIVFPDAVVAEERFVYLKIIVTDGNGDTDTYPPERRGWALSVEDDV